MVTIMASQSEEMVFASITVTIESSRGSVLGVINAWSHELTIVWMIPVEFWRNTKNNKSFLQWELTVIFVLTLCVREPRVFYWNSSMVSVDDVLFLILHPLDHIFDCLKIEQFTSRLDNWMIDLKDDDSVDYSSCWKYTCFDYLHRRSWYWEGKILVTISTQT